MAVAVAAVVVVDVDAETDTDRKKHLFQARSVRDLELKKYKTPPVPDVSGTGGVFCFWSGLRPLAING